jgi:transcriptional regulator with XRE-family HTH domain
MGKILKFREFQEGLALAIKYFREKRNLSMHEVARRAGCSVSTISIFEIVGAQKRAPNIRTLYEICSVLGVALPELITTAWTLAESSKLNGLANKIARKMEGLKSAEIAMSSKLSHFVSRT